MRDKRVTLALSAYNKVDSLATQLAEAQQYLNDLFDALTEDQRREYVETLAQRGVTYERTS